MTASTPNNVFTDCAKRASDLLASDKQRKSQDDVKAKRRTSKYSSTDDTRQLGKPTLGTIVGSHLIKSMVMFRGTPWSS